MNLRKRRNKAITLEYLVNYLGYPAEYFGWSSSINNYIPIQGIDIEQNGKKASVVLTTVNELQVLEDRIQILIVPDFFNLEYLKLVLDVYFKTDYKWN